MNRMLRKAIKKFTESIYISRTDVIKINDLYSYTPLCNWQHCEYQLRMITPGDLNQIRAEHGRTVENRFLDRLVSSWGYGVFMDNTTLGWLWLTRSSRLKEGAVPFFYPVHPPQGSIYIFDVYAAPAARGQGVMTLLFPYVLAELQQMGNRCVFLTHDKNNTAMESLARVNGFTSAGYLHYRRWFGWKNQDITDLEKACVLN